MHGLTVSIAASAIPIQSGITRTLFALNVPKFRQVPRADLMNIIFSPGRMFSTSGPTSSTIPTPSFPGMLGRVILTGYFPKN